MKRNIIYFVVTLVSFFSVVSYSDAKVSFGAGIGLLYNGLGINTGLMNDSDFKYLSLGCNRIEDSSVDGTTVEYGLGAGWMRSDILSENDKHALGIHTGVIFDTGEDISDAEPFLGISYMYFFSRMTTSGWHIGITPGIRKQDDDITWIIFPELGYQF